MWTWRKPLSLDFVKVLGHWRRWWHWTTKYSYRVVLYEAEIKTWICPRLRAQDWKVLSKNGDDLERWFKASGKGLMRYTVHEDKSSNQYRHSMNHTVSYVEIGFTNRDTALLCKLIMGGK